MKNGKIILAGFGGQGILFAGKVLAYSGLKAEREVSWLPSYGPEMRGGTANCHVVVSDAPVGSPIIPNPNILIAMNRPSLDKFEELVDKDGYIVYDSSLIDREVERKDIKVFPIPATQMAMEAGLDSLANMVIVGKVLKETGLYTLEEITKGLEKSVPPTKATLLEKNMQAIKLGYEYEL
ncbi:MAG: 2-oxoacid:acceptor oxidoreductase family protein [Clostridia bacterium]|nr:2-oxoacid:acceptor oxidoreductase family protein [Clostridia bacterium]MBQ3553381.1 2-oxoacid:acceptor oxidoreductase family protein [Clostridia bacterium]